MKLLHLPLNVPGSEQVGQRNGFRHVFGAENVYEFDYLRQEGEQGQQMANDGLTAIIAGWEPDIIWAQIQMTHTIFPGTWERVKKDYPNLWLTCFSGDARDEVPVPMQQYLPFMDIFYNCTDQGMYQKHAKRVEFMPIGVDPDEVSDFSHKTGPVPVIIFIGNNYGATFSNGAFRAELMHVLSVEFGDAFGVYGTGWDMGQVNALGPTVLKRQSAYYGHAQCVISVDHIEGILHWSERLPWALASGTPVVAQHQPGIEAWFTPEDDLLYFGRITDCISQVKRVMANDFDPSMTEQAQDKILNHHTWVQRAEQVKKDYEERHNQ